MIAGLSNKRLPFVQESFFEGNGNYNHKGVDLWLMSLAKVSISYGN
jgi:hypothetical protein